MSATAASRDEVTPSRMSARATGRRLTAIPAEEELLLLTAGGPENDDAIRDASSGAVDWQRFLGLAQIERAVPVVYPRLRTIASGFVPTDVLDQMRRLALVSDFAMLHLDSRLRESLRALDDAQVRVMLLKGAALGNTVYGGVRQRPMSDLDILVDPSNAQLARRVLLGSGWREIVGGIPDTVYDRPHHLPPLRDARSPELQIEVHTALFPERQPFAFAASSLWPRAKPLGMQLPRAFAPDPIDLLLHACLHFLWSHQGRFGVWRTIRDIDALTRRASIDWGAFVTSAREVRGTTSCYWTFRIAELTAGVRVPPTVLAELRPPRNAYVRQAVERHFIRNLFPVEFECPSVALDHLLWELGVMPRWSGHGEVRPWDEEGDFVVPGSNALGPSPIGASKRRSRLRASVRYIAKLLNDRS